ncbi:UDP-glycosyltransferase 71A16-like [Apium graveolens]|uniref:UDP-glycosyltransferase 71A16-like n=1 Tax=Apium graveolens TaxID=4045 RepID=UPI003D7A0E29
MTILSHWGLKSMLESIWCGVPVAAWPMYAKQQLNTFELVKELELPVKITRDYVKGTDCFVKEQEDREGIRCLMQEESETRNKAKEMKGICFIAKGSSSYSSVGQFIEDLVDF